ncbi:MAG: phosphoglycerate kinase [Alphaproteobacteria bacterium]|nr:MAG: phosphoglycerate kinase [Alphaproteobacteria bacterium]
MRYLSSCDTTSLEGKTAVVRVDLNLPVIDGRVFDDSRIHAIKPTIEFLRTHGCGVRLLAHMGRPQGKPVPAFSLESLIPTLEAVLGIPVVFSLDYAPSDAPVVLYENLRFFPGEELNNPLFAHELAKLGHFFVNDAFSVSHRAHASTVGITNHLEAYAGITLSHEIDGLQALLTTPKRPLIAIIGGAKIATKIHLVENLLKTCDHVYLGGGLATTFLKAQGFNLGRSLVEEKLLDWAQGILQTHKNLHLPIDAVVSTALAAGASAHTMTTVDVANDAMMVDIGPFSRSQLCDLCAKGGTVVWNGPVGAFEYPPFHEGTVAGLRYLATETRLGNLVSIIGGGETVAAAKMAGCMGDFSFVSTAGGAFLEWLEGRELPGIKALGYEYTPKGNHS